MMHLNTVLKSVGEGFPDLEYSHLLSICQSKVAMFLAKNTEDSITFEYKLNKDDSEEDIVTFTLEKGKVEAQRTDGNVNLNLISGEQQVTMIGKPMENIKLVDSSQLDTDVKSVLPFLGFDDYVDNPPLGCVRENKGSTFKEKNLDGQWICGG